MKNVLIDMLELFSEYCGFSKDDVYLLMSVGGDFIVIQVVDMVQGVYVKIFRSVMNKGEFDGEQFKKVLNVQEFSRFV